MAGVEFRGRGVYLPEPDALVVADLHVGRDATSPVELPLGERRDLTERLAELLTAFEPSEVVFAGDVLHAFDRIPDGVERTVSDLRTMVADADVRSVVVRGNHDGLLDEVGVPCRAERRLSDGTVVLHGHAPPSADAARYVVGHDHPAIEIEGQRRPCLLYGPDAYRGADVLVLPAFNRLAPGVVVNGMRASDFGSPLVTGVDDYRPVVWDADAGDALWFPPLGEFRGMLS